MNNSISVEPLVDITPDVRLLRVLRNSGFNNMTAMGELLDNAVDAGAKYIDVYVQEQGNGKRMVTTVDNGKGMSESVLQYALTLAKELKVGIDQLGKFGMGMKVASLSMTTQIEIFTKVRHGNVLYGEFNINKIEAAGSFKTTVRKASKEEEEYFYSKLGKSHSGTVIILKNCDRINVKAETLANQLEEYIGRTYRVFINRGIVFTISNSHNRGREIKSIDPLMREHQDTIVFLERETFPIDYPISEGHVKTTFIEVSAVVLPKPDNKGRFVGGVKVPLTINPANQGLYFLREGREVASAMTWIPVTGERHPSMNRFRLEIVVKSDLDDEVNMDFQKGNVYPKAGLKQQLGEIIKYGILKNMKAFLEAEENKKGKLKDANFKKASSDKDIGTEEKKTINNLEVNGLDESLTIKPSTLDNIKTNVKKEQHSLTNPGNTVGMNLDRNDKKVENDLDKGNIIATAWKIREVLSNPDTPVNIKKEILEILSL
ncbi:ATP-binding protein [Sutcliffiella horikoshii]|uniref:ATP-binding protein n=1 Tax=Sutcliffiella horikoshii TaxID=79883 RepID=UPI003CFAD178